MIFQNCFDAMDPFLLQQQLQTDEIKIRDKTRDFAQSKLMPIVVDAFRHESFDRSIMLAFGEENLLGGTISGYGCPGLNPIMYGLLNREIERVDSGYRSALSIQTSLFMQAIYRYGSDEQKNKYLSLCAKGQIIGCFGLTEPTHGSDPSGMESHVVEETDQFILNAHKRWIGLSPIADILLIWAKDQNQQIRGFLVERDRVGLTTPIIQGKCGLRTAPTGEIICDGVRLPKNAVLPQANGLNAVFNCLNHARYSIAWGALGAAEFCWHFAREYALQRKQFDKAIASFQLVQEKLVYMQTQITLALQACLRTAHLIHQEKASYQLISLIKRNSASIALNIARLARDILGGNGIVDDFHIMRHLTNLEAVITYEGTHDIHTLILGEAQTGLAAFR